MSATTLRRSPKRRSTTFTKVLEDYPTSDKAAAAQLKKGLIYLKMGDQGQGVVNLQYVVYEHPGHPRGRPRPRAAPFTRSHHSVRLEA